MRGGRLHPWRVLLQFHRAPARHRTALREAVAFRLGEPARYRPIPPLLGDAESAARAVIAVYDGVTVQLLLDGDSAAAHAWLKQLLTALLTASSAPSAPLTTLTHTKEDAHLHGR